MKREFTRAQVLAQVKGSPVLSPGLLGLEFTRVARGMGPGHREWTIEMPLAMAEGLVRSREQLAAERENVARLEGHIRQLRHRIENDPNAERYRASLRKYLESLEAKLAKMRSGATGGGAGEDGK